MANSIIVRASSRLDPQTLTRIKEFAKNKYHVVSQIEQTLDKSLVAGFIVTINGIEHDYSISGMLVRMGQAI